jgi:hypothetical protein
MPTSPAPTEVTEPEGTPEASPKASPEASVAESGHAESSAKEPSAPGGFLGLPLNPKGPLETRPSGPSALRGSRWVDYDTHELL